jgi:hypothetical protein
MVYGKSQKGSASNSGRLQGFNGNGAQRGVRPGANGGLVSGQILSQDDKSVTLKLLDGGSKIIFFSASTQITKSATGAVADLTVGENLMINGTTNTDGSITAQTIQIRPKIQQENAPMPPVLPKS